MKLNLKEIGLDERGKIYVHEHLTPYISNLAFRCRCIKRQNKTEKTKDIVKMLVRVGDINFRWINIQPIDDIAKYLICVMISFC